MAYLKSNRLHPGWEIGLSILVLLVLNYYVQLGIGPNYRYMQPDSGAFSYCGRIISQGGLMYQDCWDNKPPAIYYLNALVLSLGGQQLWALWLFQATWTGLTLVAFYLLIRRVWGQGVGILAGLLFAFTVLYPGYYQRGNLTETYVLLFIIVALAAVYAYLRTGRLGWLVGLGAAGAGAFLFKPTYIATLLAALALLTLLRWRGRAGRLWLREVGATAAGFAALVVPVLGYWAARGALADLWFAVFTHNRLYVQAGFSLRSALATLRLFWFNQPMAAVMALAFIAAVAFWVRHTDRYFHQGRLLDLGQPGQLEPDQVRHHWTVLLQIAVVLEIVLVGVSGKNFGHYFLVPLPAMIACAAYLFAWLQQALSGPASKTTETRSLYAILAVAMLVIAAPWAVEVVGKDLPDPRAVLRGEERGFSDLELFIMESTDPNQPVLIWGYEPAVYVITGRSAPTRFVFLQHLFTPIPGAATGFDLFLQELEADPPQIIATNKNGSHDLEYLGLPVESLCAGCTLEGRAGVLAVRDFMDRYYEPYTDIGEWAIYRRIAR